MTKCRLCDREGLKMTESHIVPKSLYGTTLTSKAGPARIISGTEGIRPSRSPKGVYDKRILCIDCEAMALKLADEEYQLFEVWDHWSQTAPNYDGLTMEKWDQLAPALDGQKATVTVATLIYWAREYGWDPEPWKRRAQDLRFTGAEDALEALRNTAPDPTTKSAVDAAPVTKPGKPPRVKDDLTRPGGACRAVDRFWRAAQQSLDQASRTWRRIGRG